MLLVKGSLLLLKGSFLLPKGFLLLPKGSKEGLDDKSLILGKDEEPVLGF